MPSKTVQQVHFGDFGGHQFERLVFAYLLRTSRWKSLEWYGQVGSDLGRDIWGIRDPPNADITVCVQCVTSKLSYLKIRSDIDKIAAGPLGPPRELLVVTGSSVSAKLRDRVKVYASQKGVPDSTTYSGEEFEERLRADAEPLLKRFVQGIEFPDTAAEIGAFVKRLSTPPDEQVLALMAELFDRPAFHTPFYDESSIPDFKKAITDTIEALNTGIHRLRDGTEIRRIPTRHDFQSQDTRDALSRIERMLTEVRAKYDNYIKSREIRPCGCSDPKCPVFMISPQAARSMDVLRGSILAEFKKLYPPFSVGDRQWILTSLANYKEGVLQRLDLI